MRVLDLVSQLVAVLIMAIVVLGLLMSAANCVAPTPKPVQSARMAPALEMYRTFGLLPETIRLHNDDIERAALARYELQARGGL